MAQCVYLMWPKQALLSRLDCVHTHTKAMYGHARQATVYVCFSNGAETWWYYKLVSSHWHNVADKDKTEKASSLQREQAH